MVWGARYVSRMDCVVGGFGCAGFLVCWREACRPLAACVKLCLSFWCHHHYVKVYPLCMAGALFNCT